MSAQARRFPDLDIAAVETDGLDARDAALAHAIYDAAIRRWLTLEFLLDTRLTVPLRELEPKLQGVLLAGAAQLFFLNRVPDHAVINEAVEWAKRSIRPGAGAMANAVLRKVAALRTGERREAWTDRRDELPLADGTALGLADAVLPGDPIERLALATSHPRALLERWAAAHGAANARADALHGLIQPPTLLNTLHAASPLPEGVTEPHRIEGHRVFTGDRAGLIELLSSRADVWVQDPSSSAAVLAARGLRPRVVADVCAGQGTKTRQLSAVFPDAEIVATDTDPGRLGVLRETFGVGGQVMVMTMPELRGRWAGRADLVLLDVPCSNTGVLARRAEARYRAGSGAMERLLGTQKQIIADAIPLLALRGVILYSTCSLEPEENEHQGAWTKRWHGYRVRGARTMLPAGRPGGDAREYTDGSFSCLLDSAG